MIEFRGVTKRFRDANGEAVHALRGLDLRIEAGETHGLIGTSGCGKTTSLRMINRLEDASDGELLVDGRTNRDADVYALRRRIGYVIQTGGLFPHMTVAENIGLLCKLSGWQAARTEQRVGELLELVALPADAFAPRYPWELSGGQRQRVGIARALALDPEYVLMDEPFGALDPITRAQLHRDLGPIFRGSKTVVLVTHDLHEAFTLADRVTIMHEGRVQQSATPDELRRAPANAFVADFLAAHRGPGSA